MSIIFPVISYLPITYTMLYFSTDIVEKHYNI